MLTCDCCDYAAEADDLPDAEDLTQRLEYGCPYTNKECPECGALCYPEENPAS